LTHEDAMRDALTSVLMSPHFCYRLDLPGPGGGNASVRPLSDYSLASRLSYFLWSSAPDRQLLDLAAAGELAPAGGAAAQARRMLQDDRAHGFATEFAGNWLDFRRFQEHNSVDRGHFPNFDDDCGRRCSRSDPLLPRCRPARPAGARFPLRRRYVRQPRPRPALRDAGTKIGSDGWARVDGAGQFGPAGCCRWRSS